VVLHNTSVAEPEFTFKNIFSFLEILFPAGLTYDGKLKGTQTDNWPSWNNIFWDHLILVENTEPPLNCKTWIIFQINRLWTIITINIEVNVITCGILTVYIWLFKKYPSLALATLSLSFSSFREINSVW